VTNSLSSLIRFRILSIPFGKLKIENYGCSAPLEECYITATCQVRCSHIDALQGLNNRTSLSNKHELMRVYRRLLNSLSTNYYRNYCTKFNMPHSFHLVVCLTMGPKPLPKRALHILRSRASSFKWEYLLLSLRSSNNFVVFFLVFLSLLSPLVSFLQ
jgi:hypothetical protein